MRVISSTLEMLAGREVTRSTLYARQPWAAGMPAQACESDVAGMTEEAGDRDAWYEDAVFCAAFHWIPCDASYQAA